MHLRLPIYHSYSRSNRFYSKCLTDRSLMKGCDEQTLSVKILTMDAGEFETSVLLSTIFPENADRVF